MKQFSQINKYFKMIVFFAFIAVLSFSVNAQTLTKKGNNNNNNGHGNTTITSPTLSLSGQGTKTDPYLIQSTQDLINLSAYVNAGGMTTTSKQVPMNGWTATKTAVSMYFSMTTDLDFHNANFTPIANSTSYPFKGRFNGNGHTISNININENSNYVGLFGYISKEPADGVNGATVGQEDSAAVEGIGLINANITGKQYVGGIVGYADKCEYIKDCYIANSTMGAYNGKGQAEYVGGIVGYAQSNSRVLYCYSNNTHITGHQYLGGIVGDNHTSIENCYSTSTITQNPQNQNNHQIGPITGTATSTSSVSNCYYLSGWSTQRIMNLM